MKIIAAVILAVVMCSTSTWAGGVGENVDVRILTDDGRILPTYPAKVSRGTSKVYAEAAKGDLYRIEVKNRLNRRIGLVVAVDGRNIISGMKSWLRHDERMYILEPYGSGSFAGWRTSQDRINRFYFTDPAESYAAAFGDGSAMGVIAVAVYPEVRRCKPSLSYPRENLPGRESDASGPSDKAEAVPSRPEVSKEQMKQKADRSEQVPDSAGTGYGRDEYAPSQIVCFVPEKRAVEQIYFKYEWRSALCRLGVIECVKRPDRPPNRLWDHAGYAPSPPSRVAP